MVRHTNSRALTDAVAPGERFRLRSFDIRCAGTAPSPCCGPPESTSDLRADGKYAVDEPSSPNAPPMLEMENALTAVDVLPLRMAKLSVSSYFFIVVRCVACPTYARFWNGGTSANPFEPW